MSNDDRYILSIIIPTWNNPISLLHNLDLLEESLIKLDAVKTVKVIIADDGSKEENRERFLNGVQKYSICVDYLYHENYGLEKNELFLIENTTTKYAMLLGEDDYLPHAYIQKVLEYLKKDNVGVILANFYAIDEDGQKTNRACRDRIREDRIFDAPDYRLMFLAHQMSGLVFQVDGLLEYYKNVPSNVYPQLSFIGNSIGKGIGIHITDAPFACTVLRKRRFNYSVDGLTYDLLKNVIPLPISEEERNKLINHYLLHWSNQFCNPTSWRRPGKLVETVDSYELLSKGVKSKLKWTFFGSYLAIPFRFVYRLIWIPLIGKMELKKIPKVEGVKYI